VTQYADDEIACYWYHLTLPRPNIPVITLPQIRDVPGPFPDPRFGGGGGGYPTPGAGSTGSGTHIPAMMVETRSVDNLVCGASLVIA
jgi:hypothetical protein